MNSDNLARDAVMAEAITGRLANLMEDYATDVGFALDENQISIAEGTSSWAGGFFEEGDFTATVVVTVEAQSIIPAAITAPVALHLLQYRRSDDDEEMLSLLAGQLRLILWAFHARLPRDTYAVVERRIALYLDPEEWDSRDVLPNLESFKLMLHFLADQPDFQAPRVSLSRRGYFGILWRAARDKLVTLEFDPDGMIHWLIFAPPEPAKNKKQSAAGEGSSRKVMAQIALYEALEWMKRAG